MTTVRSAKAKGSAFELSCKDSLEQVFPDIQRYGGEGFIARYDLLSKNHQVCIECKRLKGFSWNQLLEFFQILISHMPKGYMPYLLFQANRQPCLVMHFDEDYHITVHEFQTYFGCAFLQRKNKNKRKDGIQTS